MEYYTDQEKIEGYLGRVLTDNEQTVIDMAIPAVTKYIDKVTNRVFSVDSADTTRYYEGGYDEVYIDPLTTLTSVASVDGRSNVLTTYIVDQDFYTMPRGQTPITAIKRIWGRWPRGLSNMKITGKFGEAIPPGIQLAATKLVALSLQNTEGVKMEKIEGYERIYFDDVRKSDPFITETLQLYTRYTI